MKKPSFAVLFSALCLLGLSSATLTGCKAASCEAVCERLNECSSGTKTPDCNASCASGKKEAQDLGCSSEYDSFISCQGTIDACSADTFCQGQNAAYLKCITDACKKDPSKCK